MHYPVRYPETMYEFWEGLLINIGRDIREGELTLFAQLVDNSDKMSSPRHKLPVELGEETGLIMRLVKSIPTQDKEVYLTFLNNLRSLRSLMNSTKDKRATKYLDIIRAIREYSEKSPELDEKNLGYHIIFKLATSTDLEQFKDSLILPENV